MELVVPQCPVRLRVDDRRHLGHDLSQVVVDDD
jgi:hypothetical protein